MVTFLTFQYTTLVQNGKILRDKLRAAERDLDDTTKLLDAEKLKSEHLRGQRGLYKLKLEDFENLSEELHRMNLRKHEITHYLKVLPEIVDENRELRRRLLQAGLDVPKTNHAYPPAKSSPSIALGTILVDEEAVEDEEMSDTPVGVSHVRELARGRNRSSDEQAVVSESPEKSDYLKDLESEQGPSASPALQIRKRKLTSGQDPSSEAPLPRPLTRRLLTSREQMPPPPIPDKALTSHHRPFRGPDSDSDQDHPILSEGRLERRNSSNQRFQRGRLLNYISDVQEARHEVDAESSQQPPRVGGHQRGQSLMTSNVRTSTAFGQNLSATHRRASRGSFGQLGKDTLTNPELEFPNLDSRSTTPARRLSPHERANTFIAQMSSDDHRAPGNTSSSQHPLVTASASTRLNRFSRQPEPRLSAEQARPTFISGIVPSSGTTAGQSNFPSARAEGRQNRYEQQRGPDRRQTSLGAATSPFFADDTAQSEQRQQRHRRQSVARPNLPTPSQPVPIPPRKASDPPFGLWRRRH
ncbi:MAG: hypothetical protein M4579_006604 [Chaenotheca gracillima]|nr:MAG: hypothetical protein M4579_006604 [Chaenotheca gracillima]